MGEPAGFGKADVCVIGAGVAGLWSACVLAGLGRRVVLVSAGALGAGQTIGSQGIIHGGVKYALGVGASSASRAIAEMPGVWRACLDGSGEVDLRGARVLSDKQWLWSTASVTSRLTALAASKAIRTPVLKVEDRASAGPGFAAAPAGVTIYQVLEPVLDPSSLVRTLAARCAALGVRVLIGQAALERDAVVVASAEGVVKVKASVVVLSGGSGNAGLVEGLGRLGLSGGLGGGGGGGVSGALPRMQVRPLHMVMVRGELPVVFGHCVAGLSDKPRLTISTQDVPNAAGQRVWYVGGNVAEQGVSRSREEQIIAARAELAACIGWVPLTGCALATTRWDRAEGLSPGGVRPDEPVVRTIEAPGYRAVVVWPTKLAFAPLMGRLVSEAAGVSPGAAGGKTAKKSAAKGAARGADVAAGNAASPAVEGGFGAVAAAPLPWLEPGLRWTR